MLIARHCAVRGLPDNHTQMDCLTCHPLIANSVKKKPEKGCGSVANTAEPDC